MRHLHLIIAGLLPEDAPEAALADSLRVLLARGRRRPGDFNRSPAQRLAQFNETGPADLALAPLRMAHDGLNAEGEGWYCADPVHLRLMRDHILLGDAYAFELDMHEAKALVAGLNDYFKGQIEFLVAAPERWYAHFVTPPGARPEPLDAYLGRPVDPGSATTDAARTLARLGNEAQIYLHQHPVNAEREARGLDPINGLWFWGHGTLAQPRLTADVMFGESPLAAAIAEAAKIRYAPLAGFAKRLSEIQGTALAFIDGLHAPACYGQWTRWQQVLQELEATVFQPVLTGLRTGRITEVEIEILGPTGYGLRLTRRDAWKFWLR
jgi:hypothetical protein